MSDRFSGTPSGGGDPYGYYTQPGASSAATGPSQFGTPAPAPGPYGAPAPPPFGSPAQPFGTPGPSAGFGYGGPPPAAPAKHGVRPFVVVVVVLLVIAAGFYGYRAWLHNQPVHVPTSLAGVPETRDPVLANAATQIQKSIQDDNPGIQLEVRAYSDTSDRVLFAGAARGRSNVSKDFAEVGSQVGAATQVGDSTCATGVQVAITVCERSDGDLTVLAMTLHRGGRADTAQQVAALVDEVWRQI
jgi:hypothetical protein